MSVHAAAELASRLDDSNETYFQRLLPTVGDSSGPPVVQNKLQHTGLAMAALRQHKFTAKMETTKVIPMMTTSKIKNEIPEKSEFKSEKISDSRKNMSQTTSFVAPINQSNLNSIKSLNDSRPRPASSKVQIASALDLKSAAAKSNASPYVSQTVLAMHSAKSIEASQKLSNLISVPVRRTQSLVLKKTRPSENSVIHHPHPPKVSNIIKSKALITNVPVKLKLEEPDLSDYAVELLKNARKKPEVQTEEFSQSRKEELHNFVQRQAEEWQIKHSNTNGRISLKNMVKETNVSPPSKEIETISVSSRTLNNSRESSELIKYNISVPSVAENLKLVTDSKSPLRPTSKHSPATRSPIVLRPPSPSYTASVLKPRSSYDFSPVLPSQGSIKDEAKDSSEGNNDVSKEAPSVSNKEKMLGLNKLLEAFYLEIPRGSHVASFIALETILSNLLKRPMQDVYRSIRKRNPTIFGRITKYVSGLKLLNYFGFEEVHPEANEKATLSFSENDTTVENEPAPSKRRLTLDEQREEEEKIMLILSRAVENVRGYEIWLQEAKGAIITAQKRFTNHEPKIVIPATSNIDDAATRYALETQSQRAAINLLHEELKDSPVSLAESLLALLTLINNLSIVPAQPKFRKFNTKNPMFESKIGKYSAEAGGFLFLLPAFENSVIYPRLVVFLTDSLTVADEKASIWIKEENERKEIEAFHAKLKEQREESETLDSGNSNADMNKEISELSKDRKISVYNTSLLHTFTTLAPAPEIVDEKDDELQVGDKELILDAQDGFKRLQEKQTQKQIERIKNRTGVDLSKPPAFSLNAKSKKAVRIKKAIEKTTIRFIFPEKMVVQAVFHPLESLTVLFNFVKNLLVDPNIDFHFFLPPNQRLFDTTPDTLASLQLVPAANLSVVASSSAVDSLFLLPSIVGLQKFSYDL